MVHLGRNSSPSSPWIPGSRRRRASARRRRGSSARPPPPRWLWRLTTTYLQTKCTLIYKVHCATEDSMTGDDSIRDDIAFIRQAIEQGRGYAGRHSLDLLIWGVALAIGYVGTYATVSGWWRINPDWLWAACIVLPWLYSLRLFRSQPRPPRPPM